MGFTALTDVYDPIKIMAIIGQDWLNDAEVMKSKIVKREARPVQGTLTYTIRETRFQNRSGQAVKAGGTVSSVGHTQSRKQHPVIWRYDSSDEPDVIEEIEVKGVSRENASLASDIKMATSQYVDDSAVAIIKGTGAALTSNQSDQSGSVITLAAMVKGFSVLNEDGFKLQGGAIAMRNEPYWKLVEIGLVAATSNTFGNDLQTIMVQSGKLPTNVLGMTALVSDKFTDLTSSNFYLYYIGQNQLVIKGADVPQIEVARAKVLKKWSTITNFKVQFGMGFQGVSWGLSGREDVTDTQLAASANWTLAAGNSQDVKLSRVRIKTA